MPARDYGPDPFRRGEAEDRFMRRMIVWVVGTVVTVAFVVGVVSWYQRLAVQTATEAATKAAAAIQRHAQDMAAQAQARAERERAERAEAQRRRAEAQRRAIEAENTRIAAAQEQEQRRERAWNRFYRPSEFCANPDNRATMQCANEYARAKKEFDRRWAAGELR